MQAFLLQEKWKVPRLFFDGFVQEQSQLDITHVPGGETNRLQNLKISVPAICEQHLWDHAVTARLLFASFITTILYMF